MERPTTDAEINAMEIKFDHSKTRVVTIINWEKYNNKRLCKFLLAHPNTISQAYKRYEIDEEKALWIRKKLWLLKEGLKAYTSVYYYDGFFITAQQISKETGLTTAAAFRRGKKFEVGEISKEDMLKKKKGVEKISAGKPNWGELTNDSRDKNLKGIPDGTEYDRTLVGEYGGNPQIINAGKSERGY